MRVSDVLKKLLSQGYIVVRQRGSHRILSAPNKRSYTLAWGDREMLGRPALRKIERDTGVILTA